MNVSQMPQFYSQFRKTSAGFQKEMGPNKSFSADFDRILKKKNQTQKIISSNHYVFWFALAVAMLLSLRIAGWSGTSSNSCWSLSTQIELLVKKIRGDYSVNKTHCLLWVFQLLLHLLQSLVQDAEENYMVSQAFIWILPFSFLQIFLNIEK